MLGRPFVKLCHKFAKMQCKKPRVGGGGGHQTLHPGSGPHCFCSEFLAPSRLSCCFSGSGSGKGPHHAASGIARPRAAHGVGRSPGRSLTDPPGKICPIPAILPTPEAGFGRGGGRAERPGQATDLAGRPRPPSPPSRRRRCGKAGSLPSRTSARPPSFNLPTGLTLPQLGSRFPAPVATRVCRRRSRREPEAANGFPSPPRDVNATSLVAVMPRVYAHKDSQLWRARQPARRGPVLAKRTPGVSEAQGRLRDAFCKACLGARAAVTIALLRRHP